MDNADSGPTALVGRAWRSTALGIVGPILIALVVGAVLLATSTPAPGQEFYAFVLYVVTAVYLAGMVWDLISAAQNATERRNRPEKTGSYSSCLFGLLPLAAVVVLLSAKADGQGWIFDWRLVFVAVLAASVAEFFAFSRISTVQGRTDTAP